MASRLNPYLNFNGNARQVLEFYSGVFGGNLTLSTFADFGRTDSDADKIMHVEIQAIRDSAVHIGRRPLGWCQCGLLGCHR